MYSSSYEQFVFGMEVQLTRPGATSCTSSILCSKLPNNKINENTSVNRLATVFSSSTIFVRRKVKSIYDVQSLPVRMTMMENRLIIAAGRYQWYLSHIVKGTVNQTKDGEFIPIISRDLTYIPLLFGF